MPAPKEYKRSADLIAIDSVHPGEVLAQNPRDTVIETSKHEGGVSEQPITIDPTSDADAPPSATSDSEGEGTKTPSQPEVSAASAGTSVVPAESDPGVAKTSPTTKPRKSSRASTDGPKDFIACYSSRFIGHFRSEKRISNRKVFEKAARRLQEGFEEFDIRLLEIYKPVKLKVDLPEDMSKIAEGEFQWF